MEIERESPCCCDVSQVISAASKRPVWFNDQCLVCRQFVLRERRRGGMGGMAESPKAMLMRTFFPCLPLSLILCTPPSIPLVIAGASPDYCLTPFLSPVRCCLTLSISPSLSLPPTHSSLSLCLSLCLSPPPPPPLLPLHAPLRFPRPGFLSQSLWSSAQCSKC